MRIHITETTDGWYVTLRSGKSAAFMLALEMLKDLIPADEREYCPETREWFISSEARDELDCWLKRMAQRKAIIDRQREADPKASPYTILHLLPTAPPELVKSAYKTLSLLHHPDRGGSHDRQIALNEAFENISRGLK